MRNCYAQVITSFWCFIHSLFLLKIQPLKHVIITGGTGGLGRAIAQRFTVAGWRVSALGSSDLDLMDREKVSKYLSRHDCNLLVCAAGIVRDKLVAQMSEENWDDVFEVNFQAARIPALCALREMMAKGEGHVVFISSYSAEHPNVGQAAYSTAKAALIGLTKELAAEAGSAGVRVNCLMPGFLETTMTDSLSHNQRLDIRTRHALAEFNTPDRVAEFIYFLEQQMTMTSGQCFNLDSRL